MTNGPYNRSTGNAIAAKMPSRYPEPFGLVAAEALWIGLPVIVAETAFLTQEIVAAGAGIAVDPRDIAGFADVLRRTAGDTSMACDERGGIRGH